MQRKERNNLFTTSSPKCRYCGSTISNYLDEFIIPKIDTFKKEDMLKYINIIMSVPSKNSLHTKNRLVKLDHRCDTYDHPLEVKNIPMMRSSILEYNNKGIRPRYAPKTKYKYKDYFSNTIFVCNCGKSMLTHPAHSIESYSERIGYNQLLTKVRHYINNYILG